MEYAYWNISVAQDTYPNWTANIIVYIPAPPSMLTIIYSTKYKSNTIFLKPNNKITDIAPILNDPYLAMKTVVKNEDKYPCGISLLKG